MIDFVIEKDIPMPMDHRLRKGGIAETIRSLEIGESFFVSGQTISQVSGSVTHVKKKTGRHFVCRSIDGGVRVWRAE